MSSLGVYQAGEGPPDFVYTFVDSVGAPINITGWTATSTVAKPDGTTFTAPAVVSDGAAGQVTRPWTAAMTDTAGVYRHIITVTDGGQYTTISRHLSWVVETFP